jgi:hypothetical protein
MLETHQARKSASRSVRRETGYSHYATQSRSFAKAALVGVVQGRDGEEVGARKASGLNL